jgi:hypothetical protein
MKHVLLALAALLLGGGALAHAAGQNKAVSGAGGGSCTIDGQIDQRDRAAIDASALAFVNSVLASDAEQAYSAMTKEVQAHTPATQFAASVAGLQNMAPYGNVHVAHTYFISSIGSGMEARALCGSVGGNNWVSVAIKLGRTQAHVEIAASTRNNDWIFTLWLLPESGAWKVQYFNTSASAIVGQGPEMLLARARAERAAGRMFNAAMLYAGVQATAGRGPTFQLGIMQDLQKDLTSFKAPQDLKGATPYRWTLAGHAYKVAQVSLIGFQGQLGLIFTLTKAEWRGDADADESNRAFIADFRSAHPDYSRAFAFLVASATKPDDSGGFRTVYDNAKGFD